MQVVVLKINCA